MALGFKPTVAQSLLNALLNATAYTGPATPFVKLHLNDPGAAGSGNPAVNTTRQAASFATASATTGQCANDVALAWTNVPNTEAYTHWSLWDAATAGNFLGSGTLTANPVTVGDSFTIPIGALVVSLLIAA